MEKIVNCHLVCEKFSADLFEHLTQRYKTTKYKDIIVVELENDGVIIVFMFGVYISWNVDFETTKFFEDFLLQMQVEPLDNILMEKFSYKVESEFKMNFDKVILNDNSILTKLAISTSLAQNIKLTYFENFIQDTIENNSTIPTVLAKTGKIALSRKEIAKKIGELFLVKSKINLHYDLLDTPEFFWDYPEYELHYEKVAGYLDVKARVDVLNKKVEVIQELLDMLSNEQNHRYSSLLEWIIIILIGVEIVMGLAEHLF